MFSRFFTSEDAEYYYLCSSCPSSTLRFSFAGLSSLTSFFYYISKELSTIILTRSSSVISIAEHLNFLSSSGFYSWSILAGFDSKNSTFFLKSLIEISDCVKLVWAFTYFLSALSLRTSLLVCSQFATIFKYSFRNKLEHTWLTSLSAMCFFLRRRYLSLLTYWRMSVSALYSSSMGSLSVTLWLWLY